MKRFRGLLVLAVLAGTTLPASAGWFFNRKTTKPDPAVRVPELIQTLKSDGDESKRTSAAEELRQYDPAAFPVIVPALVEALLQDPKTSVRSEAAQSLGKLRPVTPQAGKALEQAVSGDSSMRVRLQARSSLLLYYMAGYSSTAEAAPIQSKEPPLAGPNGAPPAVNTTTPGPRLTPSPTLKTVEPPLAGPEPAPAPAPAPGPQPLPTGPVAPPAPAPAPALEPAPGPSLDQGPDLGLPR